MTHVQRLEEIKRLASPDLSHNDAIRPVTESGLNEIPNGDCQSGVLGTASLETNQVALANMNLSCILDDHDALLVRDEVTKDIEQSRFARARTAGDEDVLVLADLLLEEMGQL